mmetsp:Transcript_19474/g.29280  ORF Transcript_19474/g.29280 Transcript_19474/m.29280 type:complete len:200 (+) Transcript_19474:624-1223(+)
MRPMEFVGLTNFVIDAILPVIGSRKLGVVFIIMMALESLTSLTSQLTAVINFGWSTAILIELAFRVMLCTKMRVNIHRTKTCLVIRNGNWFMTGFQFSSKARGNISTSLSSNCYFTIIAKTRDVLESWVTSTIARVFACRRSSSREFLGFASLLAVTTFLLASLFFLTSLLSSFSTARIFFQLSSFVSSDGSEGSRRVS